MNKKHEKELAIKVDEDEKTLNFGSDTYAMAFKAHHLSTIEQHNLKPEEIQKSFFNVICVFFI